MKVTIKYMPRFKSFIVRVASEEHGLTQDKTINAVSANQACKYGLYAAMAGYGFLEFPAKVCRKAVGKPNKVVEVSLADLGFEPYAEPPNKPESRIRAWFTKVSQKVKAWKDSFTKD